MIYSSDSIICKYLTHMVPTKYSRAIYEKSCMLNNDEVYFQYADQERYDNIVKTLKTLKNQSYFDDIHKVLDRPLFQAEINAGLDIEQVVTMDMLYSNRDIFPKITLILDALYFLYRYLDISINRFKMSPDRAIIRFVAGHYYDCMSDGCSIYSLAMCRFLYEKGGYSLGVEVYPRKDGYVTMKDFISDIGDIPRFEHNLGY